MNSFVPTNYAGRVFVVLATLAAAIFTSSCGSSNNGGTINKNGYSNSNLSGTYVFSTSGSDANGALFDVAGALTADGNGKVTAGMMDVVGAGFSPASPVAQAILGTYAISSDGRGQAQLTSSVGTLTFDFVLTSNSHGLITEFDGTATGSGTLDLQTSSPTQSQLAGSYAFSLGGVDSNINPLATAGSFTLDSGGSITAGVEDFNDATIIYPATVLSGSAAAGTGTSPGSVTLTSSFGSLTFDFYAIDATHLKFIETDLTTAILSGDAFSQTGASIPAGQVVFTMAGGISAPVAVGGSATLDASGNISTGLEDFNNNGVISSAPVSFVGTGAAGGSVGGRVLISLTNFAPAETLVVYPSTGGLLMMELDAFNVLLGAGYAQSSQTIAATQNYGFNLSAFNTTGGFEEDDIAQFATTSSAFNGVIDINDDTSLNTGRAFAGTYTAADSNGRGTATTTVSGTGFVSFNYYVVDSSTVLVLETDSNQIGTGTFQLQSAAAAAAHAQSHMAMVHASVRSHGGALKRR